MYFHCRLIAIYTIHIGVGICECGKPCKLDGGMEGVCQSDGVTCAQNIVPPKCRVGK